MQVFGLFRLASPSDGPRPSPPGAVAIWAGLWAIFPCPGSILRGVGVAQVFGLLGPSLPSYGPRWGRSLSVGGSLAAAVLDWELGAAARGLLVGWGGGVGGGVPKAIFRPGRVSQVFGLVDPTPSSYGPRGWYPLLPVFGLRDWVGVAGRGSVAVGAALGRGMAAWAPGVAVPTAGAVASSIRPAFWRAAAVLFGELGAAAAGVLGASGRGARGGSEVGVR